MKIATSRHRGEHEGGGVRERDLGVADLGNREQLDDLELVDRIGHDLNGPFSCPLRGRRRRPSRPAITWSARQPRRAHHIDDAGGEAEQQKDNEPPRRDTQPPIDEPAEAGSDQHRGHQLGREPKAARHRRTVAAWPSAGRRSRTSLLALTWSSWSPRRRSLAERAASSDGRFVSPCLWVSSLMPSTPACYGNDVVPPPQSRADHTYWVWTSRRILGRRIKLLNQLLKMPFLPDRAPTAI